MTDYACGRVLNQFRTYLQREIDRAHGTPRADVLAGVLLTLDQMRSGERLAASHVQALQVPNADGTSVVSDDECEHQTTSHAGSPDDLASDFDPVGVGVLETMFPAGGKWKEWASHSSENGLKNARIGRSMFNPYLAGRWFLRKGLEKWSEARLMRVLGANLPPRSREKIEWYGLDGSE